MSDLLNKASLVVIPSGYKEDTVYSVVPSDGSGDLSFTRASNGTRVNSAGLVEVCPWNLLEQSETFATSPWSKSAGTTLTSGQTDPNGGLSAFRIQMSSASNFLASGVFTVVSGSIYTYTIYIKSNTGSNQSFRIIDGVRGVAGGVLNGTATTSWQRVELQITPNSTSGAFQLDNAGGAYSNDLLIAFSQANIGSTAKPYFPTTDRLDVPRLTYQNGGGGCPSLLLEKQSTNLILQSEVFDNASWTKAAVSVTANNITSPDGTQNADLLTTTSASICGAYQLVSTGSGTFSFSIFAKKGNNNYLALNAQSSSTNNCTAIFDLSDGTLGEYQTKGTTAYVSHKIENLGNDWYRCTMVLTTTTSVYFFPLFAPLKTGNTFTSSGEVNVASGKTLYLWGCQVEASSYPTSYIPTTSASATRVADECSKTGISSLIGQSEGTLFFEGSQIGAATTVPFQLSDTTNANRVQIEIGSSGQPLLVASSAGTTQAVIVGSSYTIGQNRKIAVTYKNNDFRLYQNGVLIGSDTSGSVPVSLSAIYLGSEAGTPYLDVQIKQIVNFKTSLTNAECIALTTL